MNITVEEFKEKYNENPELYDKITDLYQEYKDMEDIQHKIDATLIELTYLQLEVDIKSSCLAEANKKQE
ncbi:hypothetical protein SS50377_26167 [Spironucleus salmonicida]|uniref:Uncharacterized protein n=1 Tax=Spironucleus salmonicida TaxID=348837 RepID=V6LJW7_9EUKA|nr:hypothetical protein SS50377_26167 [Spironucleus salmonicida]|eukprot:EST44900.1 Hypothetical protein SS50377_15194 [Spironucleus salmonicida]